MHTVKRNLTFLVRSLKWGCEFFFVLLGVAAWQVGGGMDSNVATSYDYTKLFFKFLLFSNYIYFSMVCLLIFQNFSIIFFMLRIWPRNLAPLLPFRSQLLISSLLPDETVVRRHFSCISKACSSLIFLYASQFHKIFVFFYLSLYSYCPNLTKNLVFYSFTITSYHNMCSYLPCPIFKTNDCCSQLSGSGLFSKQKRFCLQRSGSGFWS